MKTRFWFGTPLKIKGLRALLLIPLVSFSLTSAAQEDIVSDVPLTVPVADYVQVHKSQRTLTVYSDGQPLRTIRRIQLGDAPVGHKQFEGDERTPEGRYFIGSRNPNSAYHLSLYITYPNAEDRAFAEAHGRSPGGLIFIHGQPNDLRSGRIRGDWTDGCIAVSNDEIEALWAMIPDGTPIDIMP